MTTIPQKVYDLVRTFMNIQFDPILGWASTIVAVDGYETIADAVNADNAAQSPPIFTTYDANDISWAITWMHKYGPSEFDATITKVGPWLDQRVFQNPAWVTPDNPAGERTVNGNVYVMVGAHQPIDNEIWGLICSGLKQWAMHELSCNENDVAMLGLYNTLVLPNATGRNQQQIMAAVVTFKQVVMQAVRQLIAALP